MTRPRDIFVHPSAIVEPGAQLGAGTHVWHFTVIRSGAVIGADCVLGQGCYVDAEVGARCRIQNCVSLYRGVVLGDEVFVGPHVAFTNVRRPRAHRRQNALANPAWEATIVETGATLGANATVVCGVRIGAHALVAAAATVTRDVAAYAEVRGTPARQVGWVCRCGAPVGSAAVDRCAGCHA